MADIYSDFSGFYDIYVGNWMADLPFYLDQARQLGGPILEIGAGTGRLTVPLARVGFSIDAVDISATMLALLRGRLEKESPEVRRRVRPVEADVGAIELERRYPMVMVPFFTFNYMLTPQAQRSALQVIGSHLADAGRVLMDVFVPHDRIKNCPSEPVRRVDTVDEQTGCSIRGWVAYSMDTVRQLETRRHVFEVTDACGLMERKEFTTVRRYFFKAEVERLLADNGLSPKAVHGDFKGKEACESSERLIYVLSRKEET